LQNRFQLSDKWMGAMWTWWCFWTIKPTPRKWFRLSSRCNWAFVGLPWRSSAREAAAASFPGRRCICM